MQAGRPVLAGTSNIEESEKLNLKPLKQGFTEDQSLKLAMGSLLLS